MCVSETRRSPSAQPSPVCVPTLTTFHQISCIGIEYEFISLLANRTSAFPLSGGTVPSSPANMHCNLSPTLCIACLPHVPRLYIAQKQIVCCQSTARVHNNKESTARPMTAHDTQGLAPPVRCPWLQHFSPCTCLSIPLQTSSQHVRASLQKDARNGARGRTRTHKEPQTRDTRNRATALEQRAPPTRVHVEVVAPSRCKIRSNNSIPHRPRAVRHPSTASNRTSAPMMHCLCDSTAQKAKAAWHLSTYRHSLQRLSEFRTRRVSLPIQHAPEDQRTCNVPQIGQQSHANLSPRFFFQRKPRTSCAKAMHDAHQFPCALAFVTVSLLDIACMMSGK